MHLQQKQQLKNPAQKWSYNSGFIFLANLFLTKYHYCLKIINNQPKNSEYNLSNFYQISADVFEKKSVESFHS